MRRPDSTWGLILAVARRLVEGDALVRSGRWRGLTPTQLLGLDLSGRILGVIGMGRIGRAVAERARGFRMQVLYSSRQPPEVDPTPEGWTYRKLDHLLAELGRREPARSLEHPQRRTSSDRSSSRS